MSARTDVNLLNDLAVIAIRNKDYRKAKKLLESAAVINQKPEVLNNLGIVYQNEYIDETMSAYENSVPVPKMLETTNFWVQLEIGFTKIWTGSDVNETLRALSEQVKTQVSGQPVTEEITL